MSGIRMHGGKSTEKINKKIFLERLYVRIRLSVQDHTSQHTNLGGGKVDKASLLVEEL